MPLVAGDRLGPYEVIAPLGAGGMGEVYRARDRNLNREVALKVLPEAFAADADRLARFRREAQLLAALNHLNIFTRGTIQRNIYRVPLPDRHARSCHAANTTIDRTSHRRR